MIKLLIADDEPLVQVGLRSMINWADYGIEICGMAMNGAQALQIIKDQSPELVICDIKMPIMNGLEFAKACRDLHESLPIIIILTSYEEFQLAQEALRYQVLDYIIKLELNETILKQTIQKALETLQKLHVVAVSESTDKMDSKTSIQTFYDKFFIRLLHNLFDSEEQFILQQQDLLLSLPDNPYTACHAQILNNQTNLMSSSEMLRLFSSATQMFQEILSKYIPCFVISLDMKHFAIILPLTSDIDYKKECSSFLTKTASMVKNYFNVDFLIAVGRPCSGSFQISESYQDARQIFFMLSKEKPFLFYEDISPSMSAKNAFNIALFKSDISKSFEEFDADALSLIFTQIIDLFVTHPTRYLQAIDAASNILYLSISLLPDGESVISDIFKEWLDGYRSLYRLTSIEQVIEWMSFFQEGLCELLVKRKKSYKNHIVSNVQKYVISHISERLSLQEVASVFGISPNYLSLLFKKHNDMGYSEYITYMKIMKAKELMADSTLKIYEIADQLGFESAFYFSKVFKKVTGYSPRDYLQTKL